MTDNNTPTTIAVGDTVRITEGYQRVLDVLDVLDVLGKSEPDANQIGTEFVVTERVETVYDDEFGEFYVNGDPAGRGVWGVWVEKVEA